MVIKSPAATDTLLADEQFTTELPGEADTEQLIEVAAMDCGVLPLNNVKVRAAEEEPSEITEKFESVQAAGTR